MKALAVLHIADLFREPKMVLPSQMDWARIPRILKGELPKPIPERPVCTPGNMEAALDWMAQQIKNPPDYIILDTEYTVPGKTLLTVGLGARRGDSFSGCQIMHVPRMAPWEKLAIPRTFKSMVGVAPVVVQNLMADLPVLRDNWQIPFGSYKQIEDLILAHALLWTEFPHDLEFLASLYSECPKLKHLSKIEINEKNKEEMQELLEALQGRQWLSNMRPEEMAGKGLSLAQEDWQDEGGVLKDTYRAEGTVRNLPATGKAESAAVLGPQSRDTNGSRSTVLELQRGVRNDRGELGRDPKISQSVARLRFQADSLYNWGDVLATDEAWQAVYRDLRNDPQTERIYRSRSLPLAFALIRGHESGVAVDKAYAREALGKLDKVATLANLHAQAAVGYPINVGSTQQVQQMLQQRDGIKVGSLMSEKLMAAVMKHPENDLLQARREFAQADGFRKFVAGIADKDRVYPEFLPTQATGRLSVKNPNIPGCPDDGKADMRGLPRLRRCFVPDKGTWWLCWDWSAMHARFIAAASRDAADIEAYQKGLDIHRRTAVQVFGVPEGEVTPRQRHLMKTIRYALLNGLDERAVRESNEVAEQGLDMDELERYAKRFLANKPGMVQWKREYAAKALQNRCSRSLYGRKRTLINFGERSTEENSKAAISGFLQGTEVDIMVETLVEALRRWPQARLVYTSHDGVKLAFPDSIDPDAVMKDLRPWIEREHDFWGIKMPLPAEFEIVTP